MQLFQLYIDPGTGSMLISVLFAIITALSFFFKNIVVKLKFLFSSSKTKSKTMEETERKNIIIFGERPHYHMVFKPICDELENRKIQCEYWATSEEDPLLNNNYNYVTTIYKGNVNTTISLLNKASSYICISTTPGLNVYQWKRSKNIEKYVHVFHSIDDGTLYRMFGLDFYDTILGPGKFVEKAVRELESKRNLPKKECVVVGSTYIDNLENKVHNEIKTNNKDVILLAPSWGKSSLLNLYGNKIISKLLETNYKIIVRPHPQSLISEKELINSLQDEFKDNERIKWDFEKDNFNSLNKSSILISDFSSVIFDFALVFKKPFIYAHTDFDTGPYDACWLDKEAWTFQTLPKIGVELNKDNFENLNSIIHDILHSDRKDFHNEINSIRSELSIGLSSKKIVDYLEYLLQKHQEMLNK